MIESNEINFNYVSSGVRSFGYPPQTINIKIPTTDITIKEYFTAFKSFLRAIGFSDELVLKFALEASIMDETNDPELVKVIMEKNGIMDVEDHIAELSRYKEEILDLKAKISRLENPNNPQYTDEEMNAMTYDQMKEQGYSMTDDGFWIKES